MRKVAMAFALVAGVIALGISLYLLVAQPSINGVVPKSDTDTHVAWLSGWVYDMGTGTPFRFPAAATVLGLFGIVFSGAILLGAWLITRRFVAGALLLLSLDMIALILIVITDWRLTIFGFMTLFIVYYLQDGIVGWIRKMFSHISTAAAKPLPSSHVSL